MLTYKTYTNFNKRVKINDREKKGHISTRFLSNAHMLSRVRACRRVCFSF